MLAGHQIRDGGLIVGALDVCLARYRPGNTPLPRAPRVRRTGGAGGLHRSACRSGSTADVAAGGGVTGVKNAAISPLNPVDQARARERPQPLGR